VWTAGGRCRFQSSTTWYCRSIVLAASACLQPAYAIFSPGCKPTIGFEFVIVRVVMQCKPSCRFGRAFGVQFAIRQLAAKFDVALGATPWAVAFVSGLQFV
jgi:hypothetical protein